MLADRSCWTES